MADLIAGEGVSAAHNQKELSKLPVSIPLHTFCGALAAAATGFVVGEGSRRWLVTCVHAFTDRIETPDDLALFTGGYLVVAGTTTKIDLFHNRMPRFSRVVLHPSGHLADVLAIELTAQEAGSLCIYGYFQRSDIVAPTVGDPVEFSGFPGLANGLVAASTMKGKVERIVGVSIALDVPSQPSFSGAPLVSADGLVGIVYGDIGKSPNFTSGLAESFSVLSPFLFQ